MRTNSLWSESSEHLDELFKAHAAALGALRNAPRTCVSHFAKKDKQGNPIPDYADLATIFDTIRKALADNGLSVTQSFMPHGEDGGMMLVTTLGHASGQYQRSFLPMKGNVPPQQLASAATYLKRVALCALVGVAADDDDDGEQAQKTAAAAVANDEERIKKALVSKLRAAKDADGIAAVIDQSARGVAQGQLSDVAMGELRLLAADLAAKLQKADAPAAKSSKRETVQAS